MGDYIKLINFALSFVEFDFQDQVRKHPQKACMLYEDMVWTFQDVENYTNQVANIFHEAGYRKGDIICLFMENRPEFVCLWLGLSKIGVIAALINFNLRNESLILCLNASNGKSLIYGTELTGGVC